MKRLKKHEEYLGKRLKRGLFSSSKEKLINADINGAINIMRKYIKEESIIKQLKQIMEIKNVYNPKVVNVFHEA